jgi:putative ABC transport system permease protein
VRKGTGQTVFWGTFLAVRNLAHSKVRTLVALGGVCFAVTLLFMQLGFFDSVSRTAVLVYDALDFDLVITSPHYVSLTQAGTFPRRRLAQARADPDVAAVMPVYVNRQMWRNPRTRAYRSVVVLGINPTDPVTRVPELEQQRPALAHPDTVLVDRLSRSDVGPLDTGLVTQVGSRNLEVIGQFRIGPGFEAGLIVVSDQSFSRLYGGYPLRDVHLGVVKLRPGADLAKAAEELRRSLPDDVRVLTRPQIAEKEQRYWVLSTSTGIIFGSGVIVAALFGLVITYQVLSLEVTHRQPEYATLKAVGFSDNFLSLVVLLQAFLFAVLSYVPGFAFALGIYYLTENVTKLPIGMTWERAWSVLGVTVLMCAVSGLKALRHLRRADPVDLFA